MILDLEDCAVIVNYSMFVRYLHPVATSCMRYEFVYFRCASLLAGLLADVGLEPAIDSNSCSLRLRTP